MPKESLGIFESFLAEIKESIDSLKASNLELKRMVSKALPQKEDNDTIKINDTEAITGYKKGYTYELVHRKAIPFFKVGRALRFSRSELEIWVKSNRPNIHQQAIDQISADYIVSKGNDLKSAS